VDGVAAGSETTLEGVFENGDSVVCEVTPYDGTHTGSAVSDSVTICNSLPEVSDVAIAPSDATAEDDLSCSYVFYDVDGDADSSSIAWSVNGTAVGTGDALLAGSHAKGDTVSCEVTPNDGTADGTPVSDSITVGNTAPQTTAVSLTPSSPDTADTLTASYTATDMDGDSPSASYAWYVDGSLASATGSTLDGATWFDKGQEVYLTVTPNDGTEDGTAVTSSPVTVLNTAPEAPSISITPSSPIEAVDDLYCQVDSASADDDGDTVTYSMSWTVDGTTYGSASATTWTGDTAAAADTSAGQVWVCTATPNDGEDDGAAATATVTIGAGNALPVIDSLSLSPSSPATDDTLTATVSTSDGDGDAVTVSYAWFVDGSLISETCSSLDRASWFDKGQDVYVVATPNDGTDDGTAVTSSTVTVLNTAPEAPSISISPSSPVEVVDDLLCQVDTASSDDDGDTVTYTMAWTVDGATYSSASTATWTGDTVAAADTSAGEVWTCTATPNDGDDDGSTATATVTIVTEGCPLYVDSSVAPGGTGAYDDPLPNIAYGLAYAASGGCEEVILKAGTYDELVDFGGLAVTVSSESGPEATIIEPSVGGDVVTFSSGEGTDSVLEGVTITGGTTHGVYIYQSDPSILDCIIDGNSGTSGGGVYAYDYNGIFQGNTVSDNSATSGGGFYLYTGSPEISGNWFETNSATYGGGLWLMATALVANNVLLENSSHGIYLETTSSSTRDDSDIINNTIVGSTGYGIYLDYYYQSSGTQYYSASDVINNIIYGSGSYDVYVSGSYSSVFSHVTWQNNDVYGGSGYSYNDQTGSNNNVSQDPAFTDESNLDFTLSWPSPYLHRRRPGHERLRGDGRHRRYGAAPGAGL